MGNIYLRQLYFNKKKQFKTSQLKTKVFKTNILDKVFFRQIVKAKCS